VFQIGLLDYRRGKTEKEAVLVYYNDRIYIFDKQDLESEQAFHVVLLNKTVADVTSIVFGLLLRCLRFDFKDKSSFLILTREKERSSAIIKLILESCAKKELDPPVISNRDRETLDAITVTINLYFSFVS
jgi:hypothetical protein